MYSGLEAQLSRNAPATQDCNSSVNVLSTEASYNAYMMENIPISGEYLWPSGINSSTNTLDGSFNQQISSNQFLQDEMSHFFLDNPSEMMLYQPYFNHMNDPLSQHSQNHPQNAHDLVQTPSNIDFFSGHDYHHITQLEPQHMPEAVVCSIPLNPPTAVLTSAAVPIRFQSSIVYPSVIVPPKSSYYSSLVLSSMDLQAVDPFTPPCDGGSSSQTPHTDLGKQSGSTVMGHDGMEELQNPSNLNCPNKVNEVTKARRYRKFLRSNKLYRKFEKSADLSGSSCPPQKGNVKEKGKGKLRKDTIRDRIEALRELVAPDGKRDADSVLEETINHIKALYERLKFLENFHERLQLLKRFYLNSVYRGYYKTMPMLNSTTNGDEDSGLGLKQRGLCLVSHSYGSCLNSYNCIDLIT